MKRIPKDDNSLIIQENLEYPKNRWRIREILEKEQSCFCAYTEDRITATLAVDIEHFDPTRKSIINDYNNWFAVSHKWNLTKASKWDSHQPVLHPSDSTLEVRIFYDEESGTYQTKPNDLEANNLLKLLDINNFELAQERRDYIKNIKTSKFPITDLLDFLLNTKILKFRRALETVFNINL